MSIPAITLTRSPVRSPARRDIATSVSTGSLTRRSSAPIRIEFSSSTTSSDDIPLIQSSREHIPSPALISSDSDHEPDTPPKETGDWSSPRPAIGNFKPRPPPAVRPTVRRSTTDQFDEAVPSRRPRHARTRPRAQSRDAPVPMALVVPQPVVVENSMQSFSIFRAQKKFAKLRGEELRMVREDQPMYFSQQGKDPIGKLHNVARKRDMVRGFSGIVRIHGGGERFTVISSETKGNDDREAELAGIAFVPKSKMKANVRACKVVVMQDGSPAWPIAKRWSLSTLAAEAIENDGRDMDPKYKVYSSRAPKVKPNGVLELDMGDVSIQKSCKNFVIEDETGDAIFMLYKMNDGWFGMKCKLPITPFIGFGLGIAMITSKK